MDLNNEFEVAVPVDEAWKVLTDLERIAPCMPGAELQEVEGDQYRGVVKVKVGPITTSYRGVARFEELDQAAHRALLKAEGRETRGQGNATALITASLSPAGSGTKVVVATDLAITGKVAQFGRGVLAEVSAKLLDQFVHNLETTVLAQEPESPPRGAAEAENASKSPKPGAAVSRPKSEAAVPEPEAAADPVPEASPDPEPAAPPDPGAAKPATRSASARNASTRSAANRSVAAEPGTEGAKEAPSSGSNEEAVPVAPAQAGSGNAEAKAAPDQPGSGSEGAPAQAGSGSEGAPAIRKIQSTPAEPVDLVGVAGGSVARRAAPVLAVVAIVVVVWRIVSGRRQPT